MNAPEFEAAIHRTLEVYENRIAQRLKQESQLLLDERLSILHNIRGNTRDVAAVATRINACEEMTHANALRLERLLQDYRRAIEKPKRKRKAKPRKRLMRKGRLR